MPDVEQGTDAWFAERLGKATASRIADVVARTRSGWGASRANYAAELIAERLTGTTAERFTNAAMQWGVDTEPEARAAYEFYQGNPVETVGFVAHPKIAMSGASPDGLVGKDGLVEIKCPNTSTHIATLRGGSIDKKYITQMHWQMACTGRTWCDWCSYDPRMPEQMRLYVQRVERDDELVASLEKDVREFLAEVDEAVNDLLKRYPMREAA